MASQAHGNRSRPVGRGDATGPGRRRQLAGAPISWGVCEVPGWGRQLEPERVLGEMASLGLAATELGPVGYLSLDANHIRALLDRFGLRLVAGFVPLVLHTPALDGARQLVERVAKLLNTLEAEVLTVTPVMDADWSPPGPLGEDEWRRLAQNLERTGEIVAGLGLTMAVHPHSGSVVETAAQIERILADTDVPVCLDSGHLAIGGADPVEFVRRHAERIVHVHLKDVDAGLAERVGDGAISLVEATRRGLFRPLGRGDVAIDHVIAMLDSSGYERWLVLEQDTTLTGEEPPVGSGPIIDVQASIEYLASLAPANGGGIHRT